MKKILLTGNDTNVGKTRVLRNLTKHLCGLGRDVQVVKLVETGIDEPHDEVFATANTTAEGHTLFSFKPPLAPVCAAEALGEVFNLNLLMRTLRNLRNNPDWRLYEAAGGFAVPMDADGRDGRELVKLLEIDYLVLVVENRLGSINQARLLYNYAKDLTCQMGFWLCHTQEISEINYKSNLKEISKLPISLWGENEDIYTDLFQ